jgi:serine/threonine-protein phosphatase 5
VEIKIEDITVDGSYKGPQLDVAKNCDDIDSKWVEDLIEWQKDGKNLHKKFALMIIMKARDIFEKQASMVDIKIDETEDITVCGDIHG